MRRATVVKNSLQDKSLYVKLRYWQAGLLPTSSAGSQWQYAFSGNSAFDPNTTGVGTQPLGFDEYSTLYNRYMVNGSKIKVYWQIGNTTQGAAQLNVGVMPATTSSWTGTDWPIFPYTVHKQTSSASGARSTIVTKAYNSTKKMFSNSGAAYNQDDFSATVGNNPTRQWYWLLSLQPADLSTSVTSGQVVVCVKITYYIKFTEPTIISPS